MKKGSINLADTQIVPKEGFFKPVGAKLSVAFICNDLSAASTTFGLNGRVNPDGIIGFGTMQESGSDISETLTSGVACVRSFEVDDRLDFQFEFPSGITGTLYYEIFE